MLSEEVEDIPTDDDCSNVAKALRVLQNELLKRGASIGMQDFAYSVLEECTDKNSNEVEIKRYNAIGSCICQRDIKLKQSRTVKDDAC